ncbi:F-box protein SNE-like [Zingiber officinale]|uniref:F-box domain-containing protein n=1 Tax=Zingiber officinale TaxID=94328 RepID=A0A8J5KWR5_ZINOF|nr:F-box protein SNE-like [Zingiber officinale]KAG6493533.1 hypothetical protein ZIOFF_048525 [Zingiber officinale]
MLPEEEEEGNGKTRLFSINDNVDLLSEILGRLDGRSLAVAACVCSLWSAVGRREGVWEAVCLRHAPFGKGAAETATVGSTRSVVAALGGYRRLYRLCIGPALDRLASGGGGNVPPSASSARHLSLSLSLSLFSIDCYERLGVGTAAAGGRQQKPASLLFLSKPVGVS